jgi:hypothetical protein
MASYWILEPRSATPRSVATASEAVFVRDGWSWGAFFLGPIWILWRGLWFVFLIWLLAMVGLAVATTYAPNTADYVGFAMFAATIWFALEANALRVWTLQRRGYGLTGVTVGRTVDEAEQHYFLSVTAPPPASVDPWAAAIAASAPIVRPVSPAPAPIADPAMPKAASPFGDLPPTVLAPRPEGSAS